MQYNVMKYYLSLQQLKTKARHLLMTVRKIIRYYMTVMGMAAALWAVCTQALAGAVASATSPQPASPSVPLQLTTTADGRLSLAASAPHVTATAAGAPAPAPLITLLPGDRQQTIDGFGYAITYSTCYNLLRMADADRKAFLERTFSPDKGYGASYVRISIGCNDFSSREYTLCDKPGLSHFALQSDETDYVIPILKEVAAINPAVKIIAAPWTCPRWMKVRDLASLKPYKSWTDGHLNPGMRQTYAQYFVKFIEAMRHEGISIYAVSPQNEPLNHRNCASLYMPWDEEAPLVACMAQAISKAGLNTRIYLFDHNFNYDDIASQDAYPVSVVNALGQMRLEGSELIVGAAYHNYGGHESELDRIHALMPDKQLIFSETSIGTWNDGRNLRKRLVDDMRHVVIGTTNRWCRAALVWNLMLDDRRGPNLDGGCQTCDGAVNISSADYRTMSLNSHYYIISHASAVVRPGAVHIAAKGPADKTLSYAAFVNPDGSYGVLMTSDSDTTRVLTVGDARRTATVSLPAHSVVSIRF